MSPFNWVEVTSPGATTPGGTTYPGTTPTTPVRGGLPEIPEGGYSGSLTNPSGYGYTAGGWPTFQSRLFLPPGYTVSAAGILDPTGKVVLAGTFDAANTITSGEVPMLGGQAAYRFDPTSGKWTLGPISAGSNFSTFDPAYKSAYGQPGGPQGPKLPGDREQMAGVRPYEQMYQGLQGQAAEAQTATQAGLQTQGWPEGQGPPPIGGPAPEGVPEGYQQYGFYPGQEPPEGFYIGPDGAWWGPPAPTAPPPATIPPAPGAAGQYGDIQPNAAGSSGGQLTPVTPLTDPLGYIRQTQGEAAAQVVAQGVQQIPQTSRATYLNALAQASTNPEFYGDPTAYANQKVREELRVQNMREQTQAEIAYYVANPGVEPPARILAQVTTARQKALDEVARKEWEAYDQAVKAALGQGGRNQFAPDNRTQTEIDAAIAAIKKPVVARPAEQPKQNIVGPPKAQPKPVTPGTPAAPSARPTNPLQALAQGINKLKLPTETPVVPSPRTPAVEKPETGEPSSVTLPGAPKIAYPPQKPKGWFNWRW